MGTTTEQLTSLNWEAEIQGAKHPVCELYTANFDSRQGAADELGNADEATAWELLRSVTWLRLEPDDDAGPFVPAVFSETFRSTIISDLSNEQLEALQGFLPDVNDPELRARIADVLWTRRVADYSFAQVAVESYLESADGLLGIWNNRPFLIRIKRALQLAISLGRENPLTNKVVAHVEQRLASDPSRDNLALLRDLSDLLDRNRCGDPTKIVGLIRVAAEFAEENDRLWDVADLWSSAARWAARTGDDELSKDFRTRGAESYVTLAESGSPNNMVASSYLSRALVAYRQIEGTDDRRQEIHEKLLEVQEKSVDELGQIKTEIGSESAKNDARQEVAGRELPDALRIFAVIENPYPVERLS